MARVPDIQQATLVARGLPRRRCVRNGIAYAMEPPRIAFVSRRPIVFVNISPGGGAFFGEFPNGPGFRASPYRLSGVMLLGVAFTGRAVLDVAQAAQGIPDDLLVFAAEFPALLSPFVNYMQTPD